MSQGLSLWPQVRPLKGSVGEKAPHGEEAPGLGPLRSNMPSVVQSRVAGSQWP